MQFIDLKYQYRLYKKEIDIEVADVLKRCDFIMGKSVGELESALSKYSNVKYAIGCSSGTDALLLSLMALDIKPGDEVITTPYSFIATAEVIAFLKATPIFVDIEESTYNLDPTLLENAITSKTKAIIPVSLFGEVSNINAINQVASHHGLPVIEDAAQSYGAIYQGQKSTSLSTIATTSFFPAKPLGGYGDGGAIFTNNNKLADKMRMLLNHGQGRRYHHDKVGINGRLDSLQAAVLKVKLKHLDEEIISRNKLADFYDSQINKDFYLPQKRRPSHADEENRSALAQYSVTLTHQNNPRHNPESIRAELLTFLKEKQIPTAVYYPIPLHLQTAFKDLGYPNTEKGAFPITERLSHTMFSIPVQPFLTESEAKQVIDALNQFSQK